jgi:hypothetical protein
MRMTAWYRGVLLAWLGFGLPSLLLGLGFAGGNPFRDFDFSLLTFIDIALLSVGWVLIFAPIWLAPFGLKKGGDADG